MRSAHGVLPVPAPATVPTTMASPASASSPPAPRSSRICGAVWVAPGMVLDVGVAGLRRLLDRLPEIAAHRVVIAVAGMGAAPASVVAGPLGGAVIGVPTSTGARRETALAAMLASCASGLTVVDVDDGYGAACAADRAGGVAPAGGRRTTPRGQALVASLSAG